jgi:hypothetical protein
LKKKKMKKKLKYPPPKKRDTLKDIFGTFPQNTISLPELRAA